MESKCPICNRPTFSLYGNERKDKLCKDCARRLKAEEIFFDIKTDTFYDKKTKLPLNNKYKDYYVGIEKGSCIICGDYSGDYIFCSSCYKQYNNKEIVLKIKNCNESSLMHSDYIGKFKCKDGHIVKSKSEKIIDDYLYENGIIHAYEKSYPIDNNKENDLHPDFFIKNLRLYQQIRDY